MQNCSFLLFVFNLNWKGSLNFSVLHTIKYIVTYILIARQRLGKHIPAEAYASNNRTSIARQRISKQAFSTIERLRFLRCPCRGVIKGQRRSFERVVIKSRGEFRDASLPGYELGSKGIQLSRVFGIGSCRIMAVKRRLYVRFEVTVRLL
jgi:hypothetical protein